MFKTILPHILWILGFLLQGDFSFAQTKTSGDKTKTQNIGIGLRMSWHPGLTIKKYFNEPYALEGILHFRYGGTVGTLLFERHAKAFDQDQMQWFFGAGGHLGIYRYRPYYFRDRGYRSRYDEFHPAIGLDGILGLEYYILEIPITLGLDVKPFLDFIYPSIGFDTALSIRYNF